MANRDQLSPQGKIDRAIQRAWIAALVCGGITLVGGLVAIGGTKLVPGATGGMLVDAVMFFGLAFGVYRRSRICATLLIVYAISNEVYMIFDGGKPSPLRLIFIYFYFRGMLAVFACHKQFSKRNASEITSDHGPGSLRRTIQPSGKFDGVVSRENGRALEKSLPSAGTDRGSTDQALPDQAHRSVAKKPAFGGHWQIPRRALVFAVAFVMFIGMSLAIWRWTATARPGTSQQRARGSVVLIRAFDAADKAIATGSGFFISADGRLLTNYHVIKGASKIVVKLESGAMYEVSGVLADDSKSDIVLLRVKADGFPFLRLGDSAKAEVGQRITVIGSPLGLEGTVSDGIISAKRELMGDEKWLQITAPIAPGSSGSPVLDVNNEVLGIATMLIREGQALNFAVPSDVIASLLNKSKGHEELMPLPLPGKSDALPPIKSNVASLTSLAEKGDREACVQLAVLYAKGDLALHITKNSRTAVGWYIKAKYSSANGEKIDIRTTSRCANGGIPAAEYDLAMKYLLGDDIAEDASEAARWFRKAADHQHSDAMQFLAMLYEEGNGVPKDLIAAATWARQAADRENHEAELLLGQMYLRGAGVPSSSEEGEKWILRAAAGGVPTAEVHLALGYFLGQEMVQNYGEAAKWAHAAARHGQPSAQVLLGEMYASGYGVPKNPLLAYAWANAAEPKLKGNSLENRAIAIKASMRRDLLRAEITRAETLSTLISQGRFDEVQAESK